MYVNIKYLKEFLLFKFVQDKIKYIFPNMQKISYREKIWR